MNGGDDADLLRGGPGPDSGDGGPDTDRCYSLEMAADC